MSKITSPIPPLPLRLFDLLLPTLLHDLTKKQPKTESTRKKPPTHKCNNHQPYQNPLTPPPQHQPQTKTLLLHDHFLPLQKKLQKLDIFICEIFLSVKLEIYFSNTNVCTYPLFLTVLSQLFAEYLTGALLVEEGGIAYVGRE